MAIAIVAIVSGPLLQTFVTTSRVGRRSYDVDKANAVSVKTVEAIKADPTSITLGEDGSYSSTAYYDVNWSKQDTDLGGTCPFSAVTTVTSTEDTSDDVSLSYLPELVDSSGQNYHIVADYQYRSGTHSITIVDNKALSKYIITASSDLLTNTLNGANSAGSGIVIPYVDCVSGIIPVVVDVGQSPDHSISFSVNNQTGKELGIYIYGDYNNDPHYVTATLTSGVMTVNYMKVTSATLSYDKLDVNVKVFRISDGSKITDYTTMVYLAQ
ncbi:hypothetical protein SDC9_106058 [bioreactor metagenome]|uniref:Uncharacterized protein n=1 Tax=bioreactor metagenome TaxID=1076179 RepID=A0A645B2B1_9ZZZZ